MGSRANVLLIVVAAACVPAREARPVPSAHDNDRTGAALSPAPAPAEHVSLPDLPAASPVWIVCATPTIALPELAGALPAPHANGACGSAYALTDRPLLL
jgi:hypothetical protein